MKSKKEWEKTEKIHNKRLAGISRRRFLNLLGSFGIGGLAAAHITTDDIKAAASDQVPIVHSFTREDRDDPTGGLVAEKKMVPADWYNDLQHAEKIYEDIRFEQIPGVVEAGIRPGKYGGENAYINVGIDSGQTRTTSSDIPEEIDGVDVKVEEVGRPELGCYESDQGIGIKAGAIVINGEGSSGTFCAPMYKNGNEYFASNEHIWHGQGNNNMNHPNGSYPTVAKIAYRNCELDFILGNPINGHIPISRISGGNNFRVVGQFSKSGINDLIARDKGAAKNGVTTCRTTGKIKTANGYIGPTPGGCWYRGHQVKGKWNFESGDSGSPVYRQVGGGDVKILSMGAGSDPNPVGSSFGFGAYWLTNQTGYYF